jgi:hypothetical protein
VEKKMIPIGKIEAITSPYASLASQILFSGMALRLVASARYNRKKKKKKNEIPIKN